MNESVTATNLNKYNEQLKPCFDCKLKQAKIESNENAVGVMCECGFQFVLKDPQMPLTEVVEWWNKYFGID